MTAKKPIIQKFPDFKLEDNHDGAACGLDEVGRAPLAGPVTASCVYIPDNQKHHGFIKEIRDSKKLSRKKREALYDQITGYFAYAITDIMQEDVDRLNIHHASLQAMARSYETMCKNFSLQPDLALIDGKFAPAMPCKTMTVIKGDNVSVSIAAASIIAKVHRDRYMEQLHNKYPHYGWNTNVGYPTKQHLEAIKEHGITAHHRRSFSPIKHYNSLAS